MTACVRVQEKPVIRKYENSVFPDLIDRMVDGGNCVYGPMIWTIIFATFLTLLIVPVMYYLKTRLAYKLAGDRELHL